MLLNHFTFHTPKTLSEATKLYASLNNIKIHAGGTFLLNSLKLLKRNGVKTPEHILSLCKISELKGITEEKNTLTIGAMTTISELFDSKLLTGNLKILNKVCKNISTQPIRNVATVGGNLTCRYTWTELPAVMIGLNAKLHFINQLGQEEILTAEDFYKTAAKTDKIFTKVSIPLDNKSKISYQRVSKTQYIDIPLLSLMINTQINDRSFSNTRVAINNCVAFAQRDISLENFLNQSKCSPRIAQEALDHLDKTIYDTRSSDYKKHMFRVSIKNAILELVESH